MTNLALAVAPLANQSGQSAAQREGEVLVRFRPDVNEGEKNALAAARGARRGRQLRGASRFERLEILGGQTPQQLAQQLADQPAVEWVEPNYLINRNEIVPNDARFNEQWALRNSGNAGVRQKSDIAAPLAWAGTTGSTNTVIAVIDSGVDFTHPDLARNQWTNSNERANNRDDDRDGYTDDINGWDWVAGGNQIKDEQGHGTSVAGIIAAEGNNALGIAGVMWRASLLSLRVLDATGEGDVADAVEAIDYAVAHNARVINLSWGLDVESLALKDAIERAGRRGVVVICSAGNGGRNIDSQPYYPASYDLKNLVPVAASDSTDNLASWSNWAATNIAVAAPGADILTTRMGGDYHKVTGTSAAAPIVTGIAGLVKTLYPSLNAADTRAAIFAGTRQVAGLSGKVSSGGVAHAAGALNSASAMTYGIGGGNGGGGDTVNGGNGVGNNGNNNGNGHGPSHQPGTPGRGSGGNGQDGSFDVAPTQPTKEAPPGFVNQDIARRQRPADPKAPTFIRSNSMPVCDADCGGNIPSGAGGSDPYFATARNAPANETGTAGVDLGSRNFNWGVPIVSLAGRAGMDLNLSLYYNSLVWTKQGTAMMYNADHGSPGPGFHLGFPTVQPVFYDSGVGTYAFNMITPSGGRVEMRKVGLSNVYESDDGSYTQLTDNGANGLTVITTDGTQLSFIYYSSLDEYRCTQIKDRNGNYITINYGAINNDTTLGRPTSVVDTLGRVINFNYDGQNYLTSITQSWRRDALGGAVTETHTWATFGYGTVTLQPNFPNLTVHATTGQAIPVLTSVGFTDGSYYEFQYESSWGVVKQIDYKGAGAHLISYTSYDIPSNSVAHTDSPRFTEQRVWGQYWNGDTNATPAANEESVTKYTVAGDGSWGKVISPDGTMHKELFGTVQGWQKGVTIGSEDWTADEAPAANGVKKKWTTLSYTLPAGNMGFEAPALGPGGYQYGPTGGSWSFVGGAGVSGNASGFTAGNPAAPEGSQVAFLQTTGTMSQTISDFRPNASYTVRFLAAQRGNYQSSWQNFEVFLDNVSLGVFLPSSTNYMEMTTSSFTTTAGAHTLKFVGLNSAGGDNTAFIDHVQVTAAGTVPLPLEINTHDDNGNQRRTAIQYGLYNLPAAVFEFGVSGGTATLLRQTNTSYNFSTGLLSRRLIGLVSVREIYDGTGALMARTTYDYDSNALYVPGAMPQHDSGITGARGLLTAVHRFDANHPYDTTKMVTATMGYDTAGSVVWKEDAAGHRTNISYADSYSDLNNTRNTRAFPTQMTDPDNFSSTMQYNYDMGVATHEQDPKGAAQAIVYDAVGRVERVTNQVNNAYIRWAHDLNQGHTKTFATLVAGQGEAYTNTIRDGVGQVILVVSSHAGSTGTYRTTRTEYDKMGRVSKQSNPTEITGAGYATGDDAGGYQWTLQSYDWKGRPTITTHPSHDGVSPSATTEFTYGGCGCAGGEATTVRDERGRRRRYTTDVLGRLAKVKEMNWLDSQGVYATTTYAYNARDQITSINQQGQTRSYVYDGHARISSQVTPEQGTKTYTYYADDMTHVVTDARGATQTFTYNGRHLPTHVAYGVPAGVGATANVTSGYDSAGNRTSMTDGLGSKTYVYNTLSQMTSETRTFTNVGSYTLAYEYNLASELTRVTNWWGAQVAYTHDTEGRTTGVNGLNSSNVPTYAGVGNYLSAMLYRANGGLKSATYGNGKTLALTYDGRLRLTGWNVPSTTGWTYNYSKFGEKSQRVTYAQNLYDTTLNRSFDYDEVGRLWEAHSGNEADAHVAEQPFPSNPNGPLSHSYRYDAYGNQTYRVGWGGSFSNYTNQFQSFTNNRRDGLVYDPSGNLTNDGAQYTYDATGQQVNGVYPAGWGGYANYSLQQAYDGDGLRARKTDNGVTTYALRSSVLGSQVVGELQQLNGVWTWTRGFVYLGGQLLALQVNNSVTWVHQDPVVKNQHLTNAQGTVTATVDLDSWGGETTRSWNSQQQTRKFTTYERDGSGNDQAMFRQYHPYWMRFDQPDPYAGSYDLSDPQSFNRYAYVQNDPVNFTDPTGLCTFNINITGLRGRALTDAQNEIRRIFRSGGHSVVFGQPTQADGGSANLRIVNFYSGEAAAHISRQGIGFANPMHRGIAGVTPPVGHNSYVNQQVIRTTTQQGRGRYQPGVSQGTMIGRVGAHEVIQHRFIGMGPEGQTSDITRSFADPSELSARLTARFNIGAYTAAILAALCAPRAQQAPPLHEELHTIGGGGGDVGPSYPIYFGGRGDMFDSFRWFDLWLASMRQGDARGSVGNIIYEEMF